MQTPRKLKGGIGSLFNHFVTLYIAVDAILSITYGGGVIVLLPRIDSAKTTQNTIAAHLSLGKISVCVIYVKKRQYMQRELAYRAEKQNNNK